MLKQKLERLVPAVSRALREKQERSERRRSQKELRESERRFRQLANAIAQIIWTINVEGRLTYCNRQFLDYLGYPDIDSARHTGFSAVHADDRERVMDAFSRGRAQQKRFSLEYRLLRASDGEYRWHLVTAVPLEGDNGLMEGWVGCATDIQEQKRREEALIMSEKLAATGRLAASIAHEINNPLEAISNLLYIVNRQEHLTIEGSRYMAMAEHELMRAAQITKQTLGFYRENAGPSAFSLADLMRDVILLYHGKLSHKNIHVTLHGFDGTNIVAIRGELRQVFANLVGNAIDAVSQDGNILISLERESRDGVQGYEISVHDNGTGIHPEIIEKIFQPFFTTKKSVGTGLGLWVCREIIQKHGGNIAVSSNNGEGPGTTFRVFLPERGAQHGDEVVGGESAA